MKDTIEDFIARLTSEDTEIRRWAAEWLADYGDSRTFESLIKALEKPNETVEVRYWLIRAIGQTTHPQAFDVLEKLLDKGKEEEQATAAFALGATND